MNKKILVVSDDFRLGSGVGTQLGYIIENLKDTYDFAVVASAIKHPEHGKTVKYADNVTIYPFNGFSDPLHMRWLMENEKPDAIFLFTDPRQYMHIWEMEAELRVKVPIIYYNIWDNSGKIGDGLTVMPRYNYPYYKACDMLIAISKLTSNMNKKLMGKEKEDWQFQYIPHGVDPHKFFPLTEEEKNKEDFQKFKKELLQDKEFDFVIGFNSRNIRRKCIPDLMYAFDRFSQSLSKEKRKKVALILHTQLVDGAGTDLMAVRTNIINNDTNIMITNNRISLQQLNWYYNIIDAVCYPSTAEGFGLGNLEALMCGTVMCSSVTGGMQDMMGFEDHKLEIDGVESYAEFFDNKEKQKSIKHGDWSFPVYPSARLLAGSPPTPYIWDDIPDMHGFSDRFEEMYNLKISDPKAFKDRGIKGREFVISKLMTEQNMTLSIKEAFETTFENWKPRERYRIIEY